MRVAENPDDSNADYIILNESVPDFKLILRYYSCFFNSLGCAIALVFFSSSGKNTDQNQDPSSFEAAATLPATQLGLSGYFCDVTFCRLGASTPKITAFFYAS